MNSYEAYYVLREHGFSMAETDRLLYEAYIKGDVKTPDGTFIAHDGNAEYMIKLP